MSPIDAYTSKTLKALVASRGKDESLFDDYATLVHYKALIEEAQERIAGTAMEENADLFKRGFHRGQIAMLEHLAFEISSLKRPAEARDFGGETF